MRNATPDTEAVVNHIVNLWQDSRRYGSHFRRLMLGSDAAPMAGVHTVADAARLARVLADRTGVVMPIEIEIVDDEDFGSYRAVWTDKSWGQWKADHADLNA